MRLFVINLAAQDARWAAVHRQFRTAGLEPTRFEAIAGNALSEAERRRLYSPELNRRQYHQPLQAGEIGCYASHLAIWQQLLASRESQVAVFEDDVDIDPDLGETLATLDARGPADWDMVKLIGRQREKTLRRTPFAGRRDLVAYRRVPGLTSAYVVSRRGAEKLLGHRLPFGRPIDIDLRHWWECDLRILGVHPYPTHAAPSSLLSTIEGRRSELDRATRWRKFFLKAQYSWLNWQAAQGAVPGSVAGRDGRRVPEVRHATR